MSPRGSLPLQLTSFIGRERELSEVRRLLGESRLLTLAGAGGVGKTRLALELAGQVAGDYQHGTCLVELAGLMDPGLVDHAIAGGLRVREEPGRGLADALLDFLQDRELLLVLDNCEHLLDGCAQTAEGLLRACAGLKILATSREPLNVAGEVSWAVPSLSLLHAKPATRRRSVAGSGGDQAEQVSEATRLFIDRARAVQPRFTLTAESAVAVDDICHRLDGIPLAIELAAARIRTLSVQQITERLDDQFRLLTAGSRTAVPRQQTLRALVDWSHDLLSEPERVLLRRLPVFAGGWTLEASEAVCSDGGLEAGEILDLLSHLAAKSLVVVEQRDEQPRYRLLETLRQYAAEKLEQSGETPRVRDRHLEWFVALVERAEGGFRGREQEAWFRRMGTELDNVRVALEWSKSSDVEAGLRLAASLFQFWWLTGRGSEGRAWLQTLLGQVTSAPRPLSRETLAKAEVAVGFIAQRQQDVTAARPLLEAGLAHWRELGRGRPIAFALRELGRLALQTHDVKRAVQLLNESLQLLDGMLALPGRRDGSLFSHGGPPSSSIRQNG